MAIFLLTKVQEPLSNEQKKNIEGGLHRVVADRWKDLGNGNYLASSAKPLTAQDFTREVGLTDGSSGAYVVTELESYYGWASRAIWDWVKTMRDVK